VFLSIVLDKNSHDKKALLLKAEIEMQRGDYADAERDYYSLIDLKTPGDEIDIFAIKTRALKALYEQDKPYAALTLVNEILTIETSNPAGLYYLGRVFLDQLYYGEASRIFDRVIHNRPRMHEALLANAVALAQLGNFERSHENIKKARELDDTFLSKLVCACVLYLTENHRGAMVLLDAIHGTEKAFDNKRQYHFYLKLSAFCCLMLGNHDQALERFRTLAEKVDKPEKIQRNRDASQEVYDEFGKKKSTSEEPGIKGKRNGGDLSREYYLLKEAEWEHRRRSGDPAEGVNESQFLDIAGLSQTAWALLDLGFAALNAGRFSQARTILQGLGEKHHEVLGMNKIIELIKVHESVRASGEKNQDIESNINRSTERVIAGKNRPYELWEYLTEWKKNGIRPYHLVFAAGMTSKKQLNPFLLFKTVKNLGLDF
jgi:tetratricopeptide (TPR) repeat protein